MGEWSTEEIAYLANNVWVWTEKIDGTNIRITIGEDGACLIQGKTDAATLPGPLHQYLQEHFTKERVLGLGLTTGSILCGEGYGWKIQKVGSRYSATPKFILFDVRIGPWWLTRNDVADIAAKAGLPVVPEIGRGTIHEAIEAVRSGIKSQCSDDTTLVSEGLVIRPPIELFARNGTRIITKIRAEDFN